MLSTVNSDEMLQIEAFLSECGITKRNFIYNSQVLMDLLFSENKKYNLTAITEEKKFWINHICDSASIFLFYREKINKDTVLCDIGSGAGFPALILAMASEAMIHAVEASEKKTGFIQKAAQLLKINNIRIIRARAEEINKKLEFRNLYKIITSRAVGTLSYMEKISSNMLADDGEFIVYKTPQSAEKELAESERKKTKLYWKIGNKFELPLNGGSRVFVEGKRKKRA